MPISDALMVRFGHLDDKVRRGDILSDADAADYADILIKFLEDWAATDPAGYEREYGQYRKGLG